jgi:CS domain
MSHRYSSIRSLADWLAKDRALAVGRWHHYIKQPYTLPIRISYNHLSSLSRHTVNDYTERYSVYGTLSNRRSLLQQPSAHTKIQATMMSDAPVPKIRHEWFQTDSSINLDIFIKNLSANQAKVEFVPSTVSVSIKTSGSTETALDFELFHDIVPAECKYTILKTKIEIQLKKQIQGLKWVH